MLEIKNLCFSAESETGKTEILKNLSLTVPDGKFIVITGPNGGGKSTLAKLIMGIEKPVSGQIFWNGQDITALDVTQRAKLGISYGFQQPPRFKGMKVSDLLSCAAGKHLSMEDGCKYLTQVGLCAREYIDRDVDASLSGGELKRIEIATILAKGGNMMIFDEPEAGIDLWSFSNLIQVFEHLHEKINGSILIISHQERILNIADRIVVLADGRVQQDGARKDVLPGLLDSSSSVCSALSDKVR